jgi:hypothetical protein
MFSWRCGRRQFSRSGCAFTPAFGGVKALSKDICQLTRSFCGLYGFCGVAEAASGLHLDNEVAQTEDCLWSTPDLVLAFVGCGWVGDGDGLPVCPAYVGSYDRVCGDCVCGLNVAF